MLSWSLMKCGNCSYVKLCGYVPWVWPWVWPSLMPGDSATVFIDTEFKGNLSDMKNADYKKTFYRALTLKGSGSLQGLSIGKVTDLEGAPGYKLVAGLHDPANFCYSLIIRYNVIRD